MISYSLKNQSALVTGANSGIGEAIAIGLGEAGANVVVNYVVDPAAAEAVADKIRSFGSKSITLKADVSNEEEVKSMYKAMFKEFGTIDILVNNAGLQRDAAFHEMTLDQWNKVINVNLTGQFLCAREAIIEMLRRGVVQDRSVACGKIICMSSVHELIPWGGHVNGKSLPERRPPRQSSPELAPYKPQMDSPSRPRLERRRRRGGNPIVFSANPRRLP